MEALIRELKEQAKDHVKLGDDYNVAFGRGMGKVLYAIAKELEEENQIKNTMESNRKVLIRTRKVYHKSAELLLDLPSDIKDKNVLSWIRDNRDSIDEQIQLKLKESKFIIGGDSMDGIMDGFDSRYDVIDNGYFTYGGHI